MGDQDFSEAIKLEVKRKAGFQCCRCRIIGSVEVHHIIPQKDGGTNEIDNAAPLCPTCHANFGDNPQKRKEIRQMRDWWYEQVEKIYPDNRQIGKLEILDAKLDKILESRNQQSVENLKPYLREWFEAEVLGTLTAGTALTTASAVVNIQLGPAELHATGVSLAVHGPHELKYDEENYKGKKVGDDFSA